MNLKKNLYVVGNRIALLFGNCYIGENQPLPGCRKDVEELGKKLTDFDFTVHSKINLNLTQMGQEFDKILDELNSEDTVLFSAWVSIFLKDKILWSDPKFDR